MKHPHARHVPPSIDLDVVPAQKLILPVVFPPGYVNVHATRSIVVVWRNPGELGEVSHHPARRRIHHIASYHARRVAETVREEGGLGIQQQPGRFAGACAEHNGSDAHLLLGPGILVDVGNGRHLSRIAIDQNLARHSVRLDGQPAGGQGGGDEGLAGAEIGIGSAPPLTLITVMAGGAPVQRSR